MDLVAHVDVDVDACGRPLLIKLLPLLLFVGGLLLLLLLSRLHHWCRPPGRTALVGGFRYALGGLLEWLLPLPMLAALCGFAVWVLDVLVAWCRCP